MNFHEATESLAPHDPQADDLDLAPAGPLSLIADPQRALEAARRMELRCRSGLRFYSDFRRVRSLDDLPEGEDLDEGFELYEELPRLSAPAFEAVFDPAFSRRY